MSQRSPVRSLEVALTFDDGPSPFTPQVLAILAQAHVHATFFVTGYGATTYPDMLRRIAASSSTFGLDRRDGAARRRAG